MYEAIPTKTDPGSFWESVHTRLDRFQVEEECCPYYRALTLILIWAAILKSPFRVSHLRYGYTLRLIGPISYSGECDLMVHPQ